MASYIDTYDTLAEKNLVDPTLSNTYVELLARRFAAAIGDLDGKDLCDVGCGRGYLIQEALARNPRSVTAVDIAAPSLRDVSKRLGVRGILANAEHLPFEDHFDVLSATDILEHVLNVSNFLVTANWALREDGVLAVRVPYREGLLYYSNYFGLPMHYTHLRTFDRRTLVDMIETFSFRVERVHYDGFFTSKLRDWVHRIPVLGRRLPACLQARFGQGDDVTAIDPTLGRLLMRPVEIGVIARKTSHIEAVNAYESLQRFSEERRNRVPAGQCS